MQFSDNYGRDVPVKIPVVLAALASVGLAACAAPGQIASSQGWSKDEAAAIAAWPGRKPTGKLDPATESRIAAIVAGMTLEQKIGQMTQAEIRSITPDQVREYYIGTILNGGGAWPGMKKHATVGDWARLADQFAKAAMSTDMKVQIPLIWGIDAVHGNNNVVGATIYPHNIGLGAAHDPALVERIGRATAKSVRATGIGWAFAPTLAVVQNQRWGRSYESYSSDPTQVAANGAALIRGLQGNLTGDGDVIASAKHFAGDGGTYRGVDQGESRSTARQFATLHGAGYYTALDADVQTVGRALVRHGIDAVIATNTTFSRAGVEGLPHADEAGGLSGAPLRDRSTAVVRQLAEVVEGALPIIASGGILSGADAAAKIAAGASLVQIYTGFIYRGPTLIREAVKSLR